MRAWLNAKPDPQFAAKCHDICETYRQAPQRAGADIPTFSSDEMTGIQALERIAPSLPVQPGRIERREFEYVRHGTCTLLATLNVATGEVCAAIGATRTEADFAAHLSTMLAHHQHAHVVLDNLNTHYSESVVRKVIRHGNFSSQQDLAAKIRAFIDYFNETMAKPFRWTYQAKPLTA